MANNDQDAQDYKDYLDYQEYLKYQNAQSPKTNSPYETAGVAPEKGMLDNALARVKDPEQWKRLGSSMLSGDGSETVQGMAPMAAPVGAMGPLGKLAQYLGGSAAGRTGVNAAVGGIRGAMKDPQEGETRLGNAGSEAALSGALGALGEGIGAGAGKGADYLMQKAAGMRKFIPGVGTRLVDQGLIGTKGMMEGQVASKLPGAEEAVQNAVKNVPNNIESQSLADAVARKADRFKLSNGEIPANVQPYATKVRESAESISGLGGGKLSPEDVLKLKRQGDWLGYTASGNPATSLEAEMGQAQADKARGLLNEASNGATSDALANEQALILARKSLGKPETIHQGMGSSAFFGKMPGQSLFGSTAAQGLGKVVEPAAKGAANPAVLQSLLQLLDSRKTQ